MNIDIDNILPDLIIEDLEDVQTINEPIKEDVIIEPIIEDEIIQPNNTEKPNEDNNVSTLLYNELVQRGVARAGDKEDYSWDDVNTVLNSYSEELPLQVANSIIESVPEKAKNLISFILTKQDNLTDADLQTFYKEHLNSISTPDQFDNDSARDFLREQYKGKFRASQIEAAIDALEDEEVLIEEALKLKNESVKKTQESLEREREQKVIDQRQFISSLSNEFKELNWSSNRINKVKQSISSGKGNELLSKIVNSPNGLIHLYNFMEYFDESNGKFNLNDFANIAQSNASKQLKDKITGEMFSSASSNTKSSTKSVRPLSLKDLEPIIN